MSDDRLRITVAGGKYTVVQDANGRLSALRYGEPWRDCCGDNLIFALASDLAEVQAEIERLKAPQKWVKCSERMPTENDTDCNGHVWAWDVSMRKYNPVLRTPLATEKYFTHWRPTGLKRPEPPKEHDSKTCDCDRPIPGGFNGESCITCQRTIKPPKEEA